MKNALRVPAQVRTLLQSRLPSGPAFAEASPPHLLRVASWNIHKCIGTDRRFDPARTAAVIAEIDADVIALQEVDRRFGDRQGLLDLARLAEETGLTPVPVQGQANSHGWCGNLLLVRRAEVGEVHQIALPGLEPRGALVADLELEGFGMARVIAAHFGLLRQSRWQQMRRVMEAATSIERPALLMGDLNEWRPGGKSPFSLASEGFGVLPDPVASFPSRMPMLALDRIIPSQPGFLSPVRVHDTPLARLASDHLPISAHIGAPEGHPDATSSKESQIASTSPS